jgi:hypothetical protein
MTALVLLMFIAAWAIIIGALKLYAAVQLRKVIENEWLLVLSGLLSIGFGAVLIAWPSTGALAVIWTIAKATTPARMLTTPLRPSPQRGPASPTEALNAAHIATTPSTSA